MDYTLYQWQEPLTEGQTKMCNTAVPRQIQNAVQDEWALHI